MKVNSVYERHVDEHTERHQHGQPRDVRPGRRKQPSRPVDRCRHRRCAGEHTDLTMFSEHPLSIYAICQQTIVDGVVRFDREEDPDDMRLYVDPEAEVEPAAIASR